MPAFVKSAGTRKKLHRKGIRQKHSKGGVSAGVKRRGKKPY